MMKDHTSNEWKQFYPRTNIFWLHYLEDKLAHFVKYKNKKGKPLTIIINTIKGKGIKEFENDPIWHARKLQGKEIEIGKKKLGII